MINVLVLIILFFYLLNNKLPEEATQQLDESEKAGIHVDVAPLCEDSAPLETQQVTETACANLFDVENTLLC